MESEMKSAMELANLHFNIKNAFLKSAKKFGKRRVEETEAVFNHAMLLQEARIHEEQAYGYLRHCIRLQETNEF